MDRRASSRSAHRHAALEQARLREQAESLRRQRLHAEVVQELEARFQGSPERGPRRKGWRGAVDAVGRGMSDFFFPPTPVMTVNGIQRCVNDVLYREQVRMRQEEAAEVVTS